MSKQDFINLDKRIEKLMRKSQKNIFKGYNDSLKYLKSEMAELYEKHSIDGKLTSESMNKYNRIQALEQDIQLTVKMLYERNNKEIRQTLTNTFLTTSKSIVSIVDKDVGIRLKPIIKPFDVTKTINDSMAGLKWTERMGKHRGDLIYDIQKTVKEGISQGDTYRTMADRLSKSMDISMNKSTTIVRTETSRVMNEAQKQTLDKVDKAGIKMMKTWNTVSDERVRGNNPKDKANHVVMDGKTIPYEEDFILPSGYSGAGPKLLNDDGSESINCRCFLTVEFE